MNNVIRKLTKHLSTHELQSTNVIPWCTPVPVFGDIKNSKVATVGLNPSNREFTDNKGIELTGNDRRFHTLRSLQLDNWGGVTDNHIRQIVGTYKNYFTRNPYDRWFKSLDTILSDLCVSYYSATNHACHLDIVPFATDIKWGNLRQTQQKHLVEVTSDALASLLSESSIRLLILNGSSVVNYFSLLSSITFNKREMKSWTLCRGSNKAVKGYSYKGEIIELLGHSFKKPILVLGYNHNIQSSFGVTNQVKRSIATWLKDQAKELSIERDR